MIHGKIHGEAPPRPDRHSPEAWDDERPEADSNGHR